MLTNHMKLIINLFENCRVQQNGLNATQITITSVEMTPILTNMTFLAVLFIIATWPEPDVELLYTGNSCVRIGKNYYQQNILLKCNTWRGHRNNNATHYVFSETSGDHDMVFPYIGTRQWIHTLGLKVERTWKPWFVKSQVAGYV